MKIIVYLKLLKGINWWPAVLLAGVTFVGLALGAYVYVFHDGTPGPLVAPRYRTSHEIRQEPDELSEVRRAAASVEPEAQDIVVSTQGVGNMPPLPQLSEVVWYINEARLASGVAPVTEDNLLDKSAALKVADMVARNYWAHDPPNGSGPWATIKEVGYPYSYIGENLAYGHYGTTSPEKAIVQSWLNSKGHRANMLEPRFKDIGIAIQKAAYYHGHKDVYVIVTQYGVRR